MHPRVEVGLPTYWGTERPPSREGFLRNLSVSGGFVMETLSPMPRGEQLHLWFELPARGAPQPVHALAKVARVVTDRRFELLGLGVEFEVSSDDRSLIEHFVTQRLEWERSLADAPADGLVP